MITNNHKVLKGGEFSWSISADLHSHDTRPPASAFPEREGLTLPQFAQRQILPGSRHIIGTLTKDDRFSSLNLILAYMDGSRIVNMACLD